ncbi:MAG TPA: YfhO family protein [Candidatus Brocadiia bacterium]|nr:YfhO family protein [Candidatus Brocadiia bacterium]
MSSLTQATMTDTAASEPILALDRRDAAALLGALLLLIILFGPVLFGPANRVAGSAEGDGRTQFYVWRVYGFGQLARGHMPLWNPYVFAGMPFVANLQSAIFYPTNWLFLLLPAPRAANLSIVINLFLSAAFAYGWARTLRAGRVAALVTGLTYALAAPQFLRVYEGHWCHLCAMPWIPWLMACAEALVMRGGARPLVAGAAGVALQAFAGHPQYVFYGSIAASVYFLVRMTMERPRFASPRDVSRRIMGFAAIFFLGLAMSAAQMLPSAELLALSSRYGKLSIEWVSQYSLAPENLLTLLAPWLFGGGATPYWGRWNAWEMGAYMGAASFALALFGVVSGRSRLRWLALGIATMLIVFALGGNTPLMPLLFRLPGFGLFRGLARFMAPASLFVALLAGLGVEAFLDRRAAPGRSGLIVVAILAAVLWLLVLPGLLWPGQTPDAWRRFVAANLSLGERPATYHDAASLPRDFAGLSWSAAWRGAAMSATLLTAIAAAGFWLRAHPGKRPWVAAALLALVAADFLLYCSPWLVTFDGGHLTCSPQVSRFLQSQDQPFRVTLGDLFNAGPLDTMPLGVACLEGIEPNIPTRFRDVFWKALEEPVETQKTSLHVSRASRNLNLLRLLNWRFALDNAARPPIDIPGARTVLLDRDAGQRVVELPGWLPRARLVHRAIVTRDAPKALQLLLVTRPERETVLEDDPPFALTQPAQPGLPPRFTVYEPERVVVEVDAPAAGALVLGDLYYPGWQAFINGQPAPIVRADYLLRAVFVQAGKSRVEFRYRPASFRVGAFVSVAGWLAAAALWLWGPRIAQWRLRRP